LIICLGAKRGSCIFYGLHFIDVVLLIKGHIEKLALVKLLSG
jgi:hypothetical protein